MGRVQINPQNAQAYAERGLVRAMIGQNEAAIADYSHAIQLNPQYFRAYYGRGTARSYTGDSQGAIEDFTHLVNVQPNAFNYYNLAFQQYLQGNKAKSAINLTRVIDSLYTNQISSIRLDLPDAIFLNYKINPLPAYYIRSNTFYELGDEEAASQDYQEAIKIEAEGVSLLWDSDEHGFWGRGLAKYHQGNQEGAIKDLQKAAEISLKHNNTAFNQIILDSIAEITPQP